MRGILFAFNNLSKKILSVTFGVISFAFKSINTRSSSNKYCSFSLECLQLCVVDFHFGYDTAQTSCKKEQLFIVNLFWMLLFYVAILPEEVGPCIVHVVFPFVSKESKKTFSSIHDFRFSNLTICDHDHHLI